MLVEGLSASRVSTFEELVIGDGILACDGAGRAGAG